MNRLPAASIENEDSRSRCYAVVSAALLFLLMALPRGVNAEPRFDVLFVAQKDAPYAERIVDEVRARLSMRCSEPCANPARLSVVDPAATDGLTGGEAPALTVAIGSSAAETLARQGRAGAQLYAFIPSYAWSELRNCCLPDTQNRAAIFIDQPAPRLLQLARSLLPDIKRVGVLLGTVSQARQSELAAAAESVGLELVIESVSDSDKVGRKLKRLVEHIDLLLTLPDPVIYNRNTAYPILLTTYSAGVPVIGFSAALVDAGAAAGVFMSPADAGTAIAEAIETFRETGSLPATAYAEAFSLSTNDNVLRSLQIDVAPASSLIERLKGNSR